MQVLDEEVEEARYLAAQRVQMEKEEREAVLYQENMAIKSRLEEASQQGRDSKTLDAETEQGAHFDWLFQHEPLLYNR